MKKFFLLMAFMNLASIAQSQISEPTRTYLMHSSGLHVKCSSDGAARLESGQVSNPEQLTFVPVSDDYFVVRSDAGPSYMSLSGSWNTYFVSDSTLAEAQWSLENVNGQFVRLRCRANGKYLGTDATEENSPVYSDKSGSSSLHWWYLSDDPNQPVPVDTVSYLVSPSLVRQHFLGWGVSLCWWARMCGSWDDAKIDALVDMLVSPEDLNYSYFRYNIGGGDDPEWRNCEEHHMGSGKGLRAEMPGFKDYSGDTYHWERDSAQRKIMLKILEKRPDAVFEAFSNSAPYYMTYSGCVAGNVDGGEDNLRPEYYEEFAHYLVDVCKYYKEEYGIEFKTLEPFNEAETNYWHASGSQEGCHFDVESQVNFLRVLYPILQSSGLSTVISASDETSVSQSVKDFNYYKSSDVLSLVGQWNTHTYSVSKADRARLAFLAHDNSMPLWMSEVGAGGSGIGGNLSLSQKLFDDIRYLQPEMWIDWQAVEENNDQWCTVRGSFADQTFSRVKNYYVRQQCSRFIPCGYDIVNSTCNQSLAAVNTSRDTLVMVLLNEGSDVVHRVNLSAFHSLPPKGYIRAYRTSSSEDLKRVFDYDVADSLLTVELPGLSITTLVIPVGVHDSATPLLETDCEFLIVPRYENTRALTSTGNGVTIENLASGSERVGHGLPSQRWRLLPDGEGYRIVNSVSGSLTSHRSSGSTSLTVEQDNSSEQTFIIEPVDFPYFRILTSYDPDFALDLVSEKSSAGTEVGLWNYDDGVIPTHRQWLLVPLQTSNEANSIEVVENLSENFFIRKTNECYDLSGRKISKSSLGTVSHGIYISGGKKYVVK